MTLDKGKSIERITDLIAVLEAALDRWGDLTVLATWEGTIQYISTYRGVSGDMVVGEPWALLIDCDNESYRASYEHPDDQVKG